MAGAGRLDGPPSLGPAYTVVTDVVFESDPAIAPRYFIDNYSAYMALAQVLFRDRAEVYYPGVKRTTRRR